MRLTLRTLLAWLDTVLPPDEQKNLGEKVATSPVAPQLIARIRDVVERPVLAAPRPEGRGLADDANSVAEYLDNTLPVERLEAFERVCIESDVHLAEVAACHGILAEIAREPLAVGTIDTASRRRLLTAIRHQVQAPNGVAPAGGRWPAAAKPAAADCDTVLGQPPVARKVATPRRRAPLAAWLSAAVALLLLVTLGGFLWWSLARDLRPKVAVRSAPPAAAAVRPVAPPPTEPPRGDEPVPAPPPAAGDAEPPADEPPARPMATDPAPPEPPPAADPPLPVPPVDPQAAPPNAEPAAAAPVAVAERPRVPQGDALAIAAPVEPPSRPAEPAVPGDPPAAAAGVDPGVGFVSGAALLLHKAAAEPTVHGASGWAALPPNAPLEAREDLIAPPYCRPEVSVGGMTIRLEPNTRAAITRDADGGPRLEIVFGCAVIRSSVAKPRLGITAGGLVGVITDGLRGPVGVEVALDRDPGTDPATTPARVRSMLATTTAGIAWLQSLPDGTPAPQPLQGTPAQALLEKDSRLVWDGRDPGAVTVQTRRELPDWLPGPPRLEKFEADAARALAAKSAADPLEKGLRELADDRRFENRVAAVATLALLGDYDALVETLAADSPARKLEDGQWARLVDMTIPLALARGANAADRLGKAFESRGPEGSGGEAFALALGFDDAALAAGGAERLVAALDAPELLLRRFAIRGLHEIVQPTPADRARYRPDRSRDLRRESVNWWRRQLDDGRVRRPAGAAGR
jgi:hypothetical protein